MERIKESLGPRDPKMALYPLMDNVKPTLIFTLLYLTFVLYIGPLWMKNRKPFVLRTPMVIYNLSMVFVSCWIFANFIKYGWSKYNWRCEPMDFSYNEMTVGMTRACWWIYLTKFVEYSDTIFFVLRKKERQINFLHVFHHASVPITAWYGISYGPSGFSMIFPTINCFVHIWMYLYYGLSALGPGIQKYLWWKKYLTSMQLMQFLIVLIYFLQIYLFPKEGCEVTPFLYFLHVGQAVFYLVLFSNFYLKLYRKSTHEAHKDNTHNGKAQNDNVNGQSNKLKKKEN